MNNHYCRLCADSKPEDELNIKISDSMLQIHEKLIACCQWNKYQYDAKLPSAICYLCYEKLEKSWLFLESVAFAQTKLQEIFHEFELTPVKCESDVDDDGFHAYESEPEPEPEPQSEEIFVEAIAPTKIVARVKKEKKPSMKIVIGSTNTSNETVPRDEKPPKITLARKPLDAAKKSYECNTCKKSFRSPYNLEVSAESFLWFLDDHSPT